MSLPADAASYDLFARLAFWAGALLLSVSLASLPLLLLLRSRLVAGRWWRRRVLERWRPLLTGALYSPGQKLPALSRWSAPHVLRLWNHLHESLGEEQRQSLEQIAARLGLPSFISRLVRRRGADARLVATEAAGRLKLSALWNDLVALLYSLDTAQSLAAAWALVRLDPQRAGSVLVPLLVSRRDWLPCQGEELARSMGRTAAGPLRQAVLAAPAEQLPPLLACLAANDPTMANEVIGELLGGERDDGVLSACLRMVQGEALLERVRPLVRHPQWFVRVQAANALGRIGVGADEGLLTAMLGDESWWVRYRAAQALSALPGVEAPRLAHIKACQTDRYARDMLHQVMVEQELSGPGNG